MCVLSDLRVELFPMWHGHFQLPAFTLTSSGWLEGRERETPSLLPQTCCHCQSKKKKKEKERKKATHTNHRLAAVQTKNIYIFYGMEWNYLFSLLFAHKFLLIRARSSSTSSDCFCSARLRADGCRWPNSELINGLLSAARHTCWVADLRFNVSFV